MVPVGPKSIFSKLKNIVGLGGPPRSDMQHREEYQRRRGRKAITASIILHAVVILLSFLQLRGCLYETPAGVPGEEGESLPEGEVEPIEAPKVVRRKRKVRRSPVTIHEVMDDLDEEYEREVQEKVSDSSGVPGGVGEGAAAAGSPRGTKLGGTLHFYRLKFNGPGWDSNMRGIRALMQEVLRAGVVEEVSGFNNVVTLEELPRHSDEYMPAMLYMTGTGGIKASKQEIENLRDYLEKGGMLLADISGGNFHKQFVNFIKKVLPDKPLQVIEYDHEIYRGKRMPYAMTRGCPMYRNHRGSGPAMGIWIGRRLAVFYSRGNLSAAWESAGAYGTRKRNVEQGFRMGVNAIAYSLLYYKHNADQ
ncbi:MAG: DUF4159 domain-containing protein [Planctomycetota bacterium]